MGNKINPFEFHLEKEYKEWVKLRLDNPDIYGEHLCYCGHTSYCSCSNPDLELFKQSLNRGTVKIKDKKNGWKKL